VRMALYR